MDANSFVENPFIQYALPEWMQSHAAAPVGDAPPLGPPAEEVAFPPGVRRPEDRITTHALGEETAEGIIRCDPPRQGPFPPGSGLPPGWVTTLALGEETGDWPSNGDGPEEGASPPGCGLPPGWFTTQALGEETAEGIICCDPPEKGSSPPEYGLPPGWLTTQALGEETAEGIIRCDPPKKGPLPPGYDLPPGWFTSQALGEESAAEFPVTTQALGEEGGEDTWRWEGPPVEEPVELPSPFLPLPVMEDGRPAPPRESLAVDPPSWPDAAEIPFPADVHLSSPAGPAGPRRFVQDAAPSAEPDPADLTPLDLDDLRVASSWLQQVYGSARQRRDSAFPLTMAPVVQSPT